MFRRIISGAAISILAMAFAGGTLRAGGRSAPTVTELGSQSGDAVLVERVLDGDTVVVRGWREHVRLANIDAPESSHGYGKPGQPFSTQSTKWMTNELEGKPGVTIHCVDQDHYGRRVCNFYRGGLHVNKELVRAGLAWANTANARYLRDRTVLDAQREAQTAKRGIWSEGKQTPPWDWRKDCWKARSCG
jgi:endonuclease YncB( thermonuclease family)